MEVQAEHLIGIMRAVDDESIGARAQLDTRIRRIFDLFSCGEGYGAYRMDQYLNNAKEILLKDNEEHFSGARRDMEGWHGTAAEGFFNYLNQLDDGVTLGPPGAVLGSIAGSMIAGALGVAVEAKGANSELGVIVEFVNSGEAMINLIDGERQNLKKRFEGSPRQ